MIPEWGINALKIGGGMRMNRLYAGSAAAIVCALLAGTAYVALFTGRSDDAFGECRTSKIAGGEEQIGGPFTLIDQSGAPVTDAQLFTKPALVYFGYSFCPDVCPLDNTRNAEAADILEEQGFDVTPVFISIDPARDTPTVLADYAQAIHPKMVALTGSDAQVKTAAAAYRVYYKAQPAENGSYLMDHSTFTYLVLPKLGFTEFFRRDLSSDQVASTVACFLDAG